MSPSRRHVLTLLATGSGALAGCPTASNTTKTTPGDADGTSSPPPAVETPAPGECEISGLPMPDSVPEEFQDVLAIASYPDKPAMTVDAVADFLGQFEHDYVSNRLIQEGPPDTPEDIQVDPLVALPSEVVVEVRPVRDGFVAFTDLWIDYGYEVITETPGESPTATPTPLPSTTNYESAAYYVTDRFLIRQSPPPDTEQPSITGGHVVQCW